MVTMAPSQECCFIGETTGPCRIKARFGIYEKKFESDTYCCLQHLVEMWEPTEPNNIVDYQKFERENV